jgi:hypothetical protein
VTPAELVEYGAPIMGAICTIRWFQLRALRRPPKTPRQAQLRAAWLSAPVLPQFGVRIGPDRFIYSMATGRCLGPLDGATATVAKSVPVTTLKPSTGWATIRFADGTIHRNLIGLRNWAEAQAQLARFEAVAAAMPAGAFKRTRPGHLAP